MMALKRKRRLRIGPLTFLVHAYNHWNCGSDEMRRVLTMQVYWRGRRIMLTNVYL